MTSSLYGDKALRLRQVLQIVPVSASTWWLGVKTGKFPQPTKLGPRTTVWRLSDIQALIDPKKEGA
ncbi:helix-turn-helix transcriptional regulator [Pseudanabaena sp. PCC 6802]|uniref:helix-turn-helix transcriptional regulator n=1 Tax=Pseudanabaena sp. PCC 6802 TaxID=118173 RepID=UPI0008FC16B6|nr:AlpA family phage regulatory protein [Pseudanabaena sp. PCC 6802]